MDQLANKGSVVRKRVAPSLSLEKRVASVVRQKQTRTQIAATEPPEIRDIGTASSPLGGTSEAASFWADLTKCDETGTLLLGPDCATNTNSTDSYMPPAEYLDGMRSKARITQHMFDRWLCALQPKVDAGGRLNNEAERTVGKLLWFWTKRLHDANADPKGAVRHIYGAEDMAGWRWMPNATAAEMLDSLGGSMARRNDQCRSSRGWFHQDVCEARSHLWSLASSIAPESIVAAEPPWATAQPDKTPSWAMMNTASSFWWAGQLMRNVLGSLGPCGEFSLETMVARTKTIPAGLTDVRAPHGSRPVTIAMQVRRGDSCYRWAERGDFTLHDENGALNRPCYKLKVYMDAAREFKQKYNARRILVSTDAPEVIEELQEYASEFEFAYLDFNRTTIGGDPKTMTDAQRNKPGSVDIENRKDMNKALVVASMLGELELLSHADFIIGTKASAVSQVAWLAVIGRQGIVPPSIFVDKPLGSLYSWMRYWRDS